ncbi:rhamnulokinase family protein [Microbacterium sp. NPDC091313]
MTTGTVAAIDLGATSGRVIVGEVGADRLSTTTVARFANDPVRTLDGLHWNVLGLYGAALAGLREAFRGDAEIRSIGVDSWAVDYALLRNGRMLGEPFHYRDERTRRGVLRVHGRARQPELFSRNGLQFLPFTTVYQLSAEPAELLEVADTLLLIPDLIGYWLTGVRRAERTNASTTGLLHAHDGQWDGVLLDRLGVRRSLLPELLAPGDTLGALTDDVAASLTAPAGTPVTAVGSHDTASAVVAVPMQAERAAYISCGTWGLVGVEVERPVLTEAVRAANFTNEGGVDGRTRLLRNVMGLWILSETVRGWEREGVSVELSELLAAAAEVPAASVPVFDVDDARFLPPGDMTARIDAWCLEHDVPAPSSRAAYARSIVESLAEAFARTAHDAARLGGVALEAIHVVGGGALNELLCQRTADRAGLPVIAGPVEATALGNILVQARALGLTGTTLESLRELVARTHELRRFAPRR